MTQATHRRALVPKAAIIAAAVIAVLLVSAVAAAVFVARSNLIAVPDVVGVPSDTAKEVLSSAGFVQRVTGSRVSTAAPVGDVISQDPPAGTTLARGETVSVVLSAGPQTLIVPDLVGRTLTVAEDVLKSLGLKVTTVSRASEATETVVLEMFPAPGASVSVGDEIRLTLPGGSASTDVLLPYDLKGVSVLLDPLPVPASASTDATMEIARRLRSLLEAAGASVSSTRSATSTVSPAARTDVARLSTAQLFIGIDLGSGGTPGVRVVQRPPGGDAAREEQSRLVVRGITRAANLPGLLVNEPDVSTDPVLAAFPGVGVRVIVADSTVESDRARLGDPAWADQVARAIYRGVGTALTAK